MVSHMCTAHGDFFCYCCEGDFNTRHRRCSGGADGGERLHHLVGLSAGAGSSADAGVQTEVAEGESAWLHRYVPPLLGAYRSGLLDLRLEGHSRPARPINHGQYPI